MKEGFQVTSNVTLVRPLKEGGMGAVWVARHAGLGTEVAVKFLLGELANDEALRARFAQEAAASSRVKSSHVVKVYDYGVTPDGVPYLVMELLEGIDLRSLLDERQRLPPKEIVPIITQLARALERAHDAGVVHRDIKPENVFLCVEGGDRFVKLLDFGVAKTSKELRSTGGKSTHANETLGTPYYMSPEQFRSAKSSDPRSDLWAVGVVTYEALTGTLPYLAETIGGPAIVVNENEPVMPSTYDATLPKAFDAWFAKACASKPEDRFQSARALVDALRAAFPDDAREMSSAAAASGPFRQVATSGDFTPAQKDASTLALIDTAFATTSPRPAPSTRRRAMIVAVVGGACLLAAIAFGVARSTSSASSVATSAMSHAPSASAPIVSTVTSATAIASAIATTPDTVVAPASLAHASVAATPSPSARRGASTSAAPAAPSASTKPKGVERDIY